MCWVGGDEENGAAHFGELDGEGAGGGGLSDTTLSADKNPAKGALVEDGLESWLEDVLVGVDDCAGHGGGYLVCSFSFREETGRM